MSMSTVSKKRWVMGGIACSGGAILAVALLGGSLQGCGGSSCATGTIQVSWDFKAGATGCLAGDQVGIRVDDNSMVIYAPCTDGGATTPAVEGGVTHTLDLTLFDANNNVVEQSTAVPVSVPCGGGNVSAGTYDFSS